RGQCPEKHARGLARQRTEFLELPGEHGQREVGLSQVTRGEEIRAGIAVDLVAERGGEPVERCGLDKLPALPMQIGASVEIFRIDGAMMQGELEKAFRFVAVAGIDAQLDGAFAPEEWLAILFRALLAQEVLEVGATGELAQEREFAPGEVAVLGIEREEFLE